MSGAVNTIAGIFSLGLLAYFTYKVILPQLNKLGTATTPTFGAPPPATATAAYGNVRWYKRR